MKRTDTPRVMLEAFPETLARQLADLKRYASRIETFTAGLGGGTGLLAGYVGVLVLDRLVDLPVGMRILMAGGSATLAGGWLFSWVRQQIWRPRGWRELALLVHRADARLGERLLSAVELAAGQVSADSASPALRRAAIAQMAASVARHDLRRMVSTRRMCAWSVPFAVLALTVLTAALVCPHAAANALARWLRPLAPVERYTFVRLGPLPERLVIPHGEPFEIGLEVDTRSAWRPRHAVCRIGNQPPFRVPIQAHRVALRIPGQTEKTRLRIRLGDNRREMAIEPVFRPELVRLWMEVELPAYLARHTQRVELRRGAATVLKESRVRFAGEVSRELAQASLQIQPAGAHGKREEPHGDWTALRVQGREFSGETIPAERLGQCRFQWTDTVGLSAAAPHDVAVTLMDDQPPSVQWDSGTTPVAILADEVVRLTARTQDDWGVKALWIEWTAEPNVTGQLQRVDGTEKLAQGTAETTELTGTFALCPALMHVPEDTTLTVTARSADFVPDRVPSRSVSRKIYVLSRARHAQLIQEQMDNLQARLEELIRQEEGLRDRNQATRMLAPEALSSEKVGQSLQTNAQEERTQQESLRGILASLRALFREGLRNRDIPLDVLRQWAERADIVEQTANEVLRDAAQALSQAAAHPAERASHLDRALERETTAIENLRQTERSLNRTREDWTARTFVHRLRTAAEAERDIRTALDRSLPVTVGLDPASLPREAADTLASLAERQDHTATLVRHIQDDLAGYYQRTRRPVHGEIHKEMVERRTVSRLTAVGADIRANLTFHAIQEATQWEKQLAAWADALDAARRSAGSGDSGKPPSGQPEEEELVMALMRARQTEEAIREQTRLLEESRVERPTYGADAVRLSEKQKALADEIRPWERRVSDVEVRRFLEKIHGEMMNAEMFLRKPQTDGETVAIETEIIELLSGSVSRMAGQGGQGRSALGNLLARLSSGGSGSGSTAGGNTDRLNERSTGDATGHPESPRRVPRISGADPSSWPEEFREALEGYFRRVEVMP